MAKILGQHNKSMAFGCFWMLLVSPSWPLVEDMLWQFLNVFNNPINVLRNIPSPPIQRFPQVPGNVFNTDKSTGTMLHSYQDVDCIDSSPLRIPKAPKLQIPGKNFKIESCHSQVWYEVLYSRHRLRNIQIGGRNSFTKTRQELAPGVFA